MLTIASCFKGSLPKVRSGERIYAIGDIHGRLDLFTRLIHQIRVDAMDRPARRTKLVVLGDMIDRGPSSAQLIRKLFEFSRKSRNLILLRGNHEQLMAHSLRGDLKSLEAWLKYGGGATLSSWGVSNTDLNGSLPNLLRVSRIAVPREIRLWMDNLPFFYQSGGFFFVHAGIRPGVALKAQDPGDMMWIGAEFFNAKARHPAIIVHGHTVCEDGPELLRHRIGVDTGAYRTGRLSAVGFEGSRQWSISVSDGETTKSGMPN